MHDRDDIYHRDAKAITTTNEHYTISSSRANALIAATSTGVWTCATVDRYKADLVAASVRLMAAGVNPRKIGILIDTRAFGPQAKDVVAYYVRAFGEPRFQSERIAVVYHSTLQKMQTDRMAVGTSRFFEKRDDALSWLSSLE